MQKAQNRRVAIGEKIYEDFVERVTSTFFTTEKISNPRTSDLEKFALLEKKGMSDVLFVEMMKEYLSNFLEVKLSVEKGRLYHHFENKSPI